MRIKSCSRRIEIAPFLYPQKVCLIRSLLNDGVFVSLVLERDHEDRRNLLQYNELAHKVALRTVID